MPDENSAPKLTPEQRRQVLQWLGEGYKDAEIVGFIKEQFGVEVTRQAVNYYRDTYAEDIAAIADDVYLRAIQQGFANRARRILVLERNAEKAADLTQAGGKGWTYISAELRAILKDIRDELGDLKQRHEHTGADGGPVQVSWLDKVREACKDGEEDADATD